MVGKTIFWFILSALVFMFSQIFLYGLITAVINGVLLTGAVKGIVEMFAFAFIFGGLVGIPLTILVAGLFGFLFAQYTSTWLRTTRKIFGSFISINSVFSATLYPVLTLSLVLTLYEQRYSLFSLHTSILVSLIALIVSAVISAKILDKTLGNLYDQKISSQ